MTKIIGFVAFLECFCLLNNQSHHCSRRVQLEEVVDAARSRDVCSSYLLAAVGEVENELGRTLLQRGQGTPAHALGRVPHPPGVVAGLHGGEVAALAAAQLATVVLEKMYISVWKHLCIH